MKNPISDKVLKEAAEKGMDAFLQVFIDNYKEVTNGVVNADTMAMLNAWQLTLLGYDILREEINEGGFVQLIQNGYGPFFFRNPFAKAVKQMGCKVLADIVYDAARIYTTHQDDLERERTDEEFMAMYEQYEEFDSLEESFMEQQEEITATLAQYVDEHIDDFVAR
ncbi:MAG: DMP19 family protein [Bacteroidales bacterium]|nr:DMP19 family protein [Bacteroidales bacterium]